MNALSLSVAGSLRRRLPTLILFSLLIPALAPGGTFWQSTRPSCHDPITAVTVDDRGRVIAGSDSGWIHISTDLGITWRSASASRRAIVSILPDQQNWLLAASDTGVFRSSDDGTSWQTAGLLDVAVASLAGQGSGEVYAATSKGVMFSTDVGASWAALPQVPGNLSSVAIQAGSVFAGTDSGLFVSTDRKVWMRTGLFNRVVSIQPRGSGALFAISMPDTIAILYRSTDGGV